MAKKRQKKNREDKLRQQLMQAQADLERAQDKRLQVTKRGEQQVELARQRAAERLAKATLRVEKRAKSVSSLEAEILAIHSPPAPEPASPAAAAKALEKLKASSNDHKSNNLVTAESPEEVSAMAEAQQSADGVPEKEARRSKPSKA